MFWAGLWGELQKWMAFDICGFSYIILSLLALSFRERIWEQNDAVFIPFSFASSFGPTF
jgi:hypothetical protein